MNPYLNLSPHSWQTKCCWCQYRFPAFIALASLISNWHPEQIKVSIFIEYWRTLFITYIEWIYLQTFWKANWKWAQGKTMREENTKRPWYLKFQTSIVFKTNCFLLQFKQHLSFFTFVFCTQCRYVANSA